MNSRSHFECVPRDTEASEFIDSVDFGVDKETRPNFEEVSVYRFGGFRICMGWLRLVGSLKIWVSFAEYSLFYRALLQKKPRILRSLLIVATP